MLDDRQRRSASNGMAKMKHTERARKQNIINDDDKSTEMGEPSKRRVENLFSA